MKKASTKSVSKSVSSKSSVAALPPKKWLFVALIIFFVTAEIGVFANGFIAKNFTVARPWLMGNSISWYVGSSWWTAAIFALGNIVVAAVLARYVWRLGEMLRMPRAYYYATVLMVVCLICLSMCPLNIVNTVGKSLVVFMHEASSRTMFVTMAVIAMMLILNRRSNTALRVMSIIFVAYALVWMIEYVLGLPWLMAILLISESSFITLFIITIATAKNRSIRG